MEPDWKAIEARLKADKKYYDGVRASLMEHPIEAVGDRSAALQGSKLAERVRQLEDALAIVRRHLDNA